MKYINKIMKPIVTIISNIKYLLCNNIEQINLYQTKHINNNANRVDKIYDNLDNIESTLDDKVDEYVVQDILHDEFGYSENYVNYDDMNDIKDDIKEINNKLKDINNDNNDSIDSLIERDLLINEVIKTIISRLDNNENV
tara:strand:- start:168 stop:587 length:420 start_codon:yes stop_codon:yes gene_type:complete